MINLEYTMTPQEAADSTMNFLANRPFMNIMFLVMRYSCLILCFGFIITLFQGNTRPEDIAAVIMAVGWLFFYKKINRRVIVTVLKSRKFETMHRTVKFDAKSIMCRGVSNMPIDIAWKKLRFVLKNKNGYIIPLTGFGNAGRFFWVPLRAFTQTNQEQQFLDILHKFKIKIKEVKA